jgi:predicted nucleic acid-binding protein
VLAHLQGEPGGQKVRQWLREAKAGRARLFLCLVNWVEVGYSLERARGTQARDEGLMAIEQLPVSLVEVDLDLARRAMALKSRHAVALGDSFAAALAQRESLPVVTGDPEFKCLTGAVRIDWIR